MRSKALGPKFVIGQSIRQRLRIRQDIVRSDKLNLTTIPNPNPYFWVGSPQTPSSVATRKLLKASSNLLTISNGTQIVRRIGNTDENWAAFTRDILRAPTSCMGNCFEAVAPSLAEVCSLQAVSKRSEKAASDQGFLPRSQFARHSAPKSRQSYPLDSVQFIGS